MNFLQRTNSSNHRDAHLPSHSLRFGDASQWRAVPGESRSFLKAFLGVSVVQRGINHYYSLLVQEV